MYIVSILMLVQKDKQKGMYSVIACEGTEQW